MIGVPLFCGLTLNKVVLHAQHAKELANDVVSHGIVRECVLWKVALHAYVEEPLEIVYIHVIEIAQQTDIRINVRHPVQRCKHFMDTLVFCDVLEIYLVFVLYDSLKLVVVHYVVRRGNHVYRCK